MPSDNQGITPDHLNDIQGVTPDYLQDNGTVQTNKQNNELDEILELVFWAGQHNQYPEQNREPGTSVAEAKTKILDLLESKIIELPVSQVCQGTIKDVLSVIKRMRGKDG